MPRDSNGNYSLPPSYLAVTGQDITVPQHNPPFEDVAVALTASLPRNGVAPMLANLPMGGFRVTGMGDGIAPTDGATKAQVDAASPIGAIIDFAGDTAPAGWALCWGQQVFRASYPALFAVIGTKFGAGDGSTTFNLPDIRGRLTAGKDDMGGFAAGRLGAVAGFNANASVLGATGGTETTTLTIAQMPAHNHGGATSPAGAHNHFYDSVSFGSAGNGLKADSGIAPTFPTAVTSTVGDHAHVIASQGGGGAHSNVQPTIIFNKIIKIL